MNMSRAHSVATTTLAIAVTVLMSERVHLLNRGSPAPEIIASSVVFQNDEGKEVGRIGILGDGVLGLEFGSAEDVPAIELRTHGSGESLLRLINPDTSATIVVSGPRTGFLFSSSLSSAAMFVDHVRSSLTFNDDEGQERATIVATARSGATMAVRDSDGAVLWKVP